MRLTNTQRDAFVRAVMDDVPMVDYTERARVAIQRKAIDLMPPKLKALHKEFGHWFNTEKIYATPNGIPMVHVISCDSGATTEQMKADTEFWQSIVQMGSDYKNQTAARDVLRSKVRAIIYGCTTIKQANERLPEFAKYLPSPEEPQDRSVPVVANLVTDLTAAGWPKDKPKSKRKAA
jgi:hypothetical protein